MESKAYTGKLKLTNWQYGQFGYNTPPHHRSCQKWRVYWDDPQRGLFNLSLPLHPDYLYDHEYDGDVMSYHYPQLKEGNDLRFTPVTFCDRWGNFDCAKLILPTT